MTQPLDSRELTTALGTQTVLVFPDAASMAAAAAARFITELVAAQGERGYAHAVLTGGTSGTAVLEAVAAAPDVNDVRWSDVDLWWGDERFLPAGHPDRNETQARGALLDKLDLDPDRVHAMPASDGAYGNDVDAAAFGYGAELAAAATGDFSSPVAGVPAFDVLMLGVGPDGHVASLFPGHPGFAVTTGTVISVRESPKPPPTRISFTLPALQTAAHAWLLAAGEGKADAVARALGGEPLPAASVHATTSTTWWLDQSAAPTPAPAPTP